MRAALPISVIVGCIIIAGSILVALRHETVTVAPWVYVERDRWTGRTMACAIENPALLHYAAGVSPRTCAELPALDDIKNASIEDTIARARARQAARAASQGEAEK